MTPKQLLRPSRPPDLTPDTRGVSLAHYQNGHGKSLFNFVVKIWKGLSVFGGPGKFCIESILICFIL